MNSQSVKRKIAHVLYNGNLMGGTEHATLRIASASRDHGFESVVFVPYSTENEIVTGAFEAAGAKTILYNPSEPSYRRPKDFLTTTWSLRKKLKEENVSLLHCCDLQAAYYFGLAGRLSRIPVVCHVRCLYPRLAARDRSFLMSVDHFVFVSNEARKQFDFAPGRSNGKVIYDGIDSEVYNSHRSAVDVRAKYGVPPDTKIVGMVARIAEAKDFETLVKAAARVTKCYEKVRFLIVGDFSGHELYRKHFAYLQKLIRDQGLESYFIFTGYQPNVNDFLNVMDIFVLSTHTEGLPLVVLEAMAHGKPVIATAVGGIPEIVRHKETGYLHPHLDDSTFAAQMLALLKDDVLSMELGENGRRCVTSQWNMRKFGDNIADFYKSVLKTKSRLGR